MCNICTMIKEEKQMVIAHAARAWLGDQSSRPLQEPLISA
jgi:hypothetical protein